MTDIDKMTQRMSDVNYENLKVYKLVREQIEELEEKGGIRLHERMIYKIMQNYRIENKSRFLKGEFVYDIQTAIKKDALVSYFYGGRPKALSDMLYKVKRQIKKGYLQIIEPEGHPKVYIRAEDVFGNITGKRGPNNLAEEIEDLVIKGEKLKDHSRRLQRDYHVRKEIIEGSELEDEDFEGLWHWIAKDYEGMSKEEKNHLYILKNLPIKFDETQIETAGKKGILNRREASILKYRCRLDSYREIASKLDISHSTVRNTEKIALKKLHRYIYHLSPEGKELTRKEYKKLFGYYPSP